MASFSRNVLGSPIVPLEFYEKQCKHFTHHSPRSRNAVIELMKKCDLLVLPSLVEGRALVQLEALSCGLPLIVTPHTGGSDLIEDGFTGFEIPIRAPEIIREKIDPKRYMNDLEYRRGYTYGFNYCSLSLDWDPQ